MGGWTPADFDEASADLTEEVVRMMIEEHQAFEDAKAGRRSAPKDAIPPRVQKAAPSAPAIAARGAEIDPRTGREVVTVTKPDGTIVKHRKIEEGEQVLWRIFGKPKSFQNK